MIELQNLATGYDTRTLLNNVDAKIGTGTLTALIGRNGSGKSTLLRAIAGLGPYLSGHIKIAGKEVRQTSPLERSRHLAFVTTERTRIPNVKCRDVVALGRAPYTDWIGRMQTRDKEVVIEALEAVGMEAYANRTMDTMSDGECQRIMIARALAQATPIILLDEPTTFLDLPTRYEVCALLGSIAHREGKCILFSTHELDIALTLTDQVILLAPPTLYSLPTDEMKRSGHVEELFGLSKYVFNQETSPLFSSSNLEVEKN